MAINHLFMVAMTVANGKNEVYQLTKRFAWWSVFELILGDIEVIRRAYIG